MNNERTIDSLDPKFKSSFDSSLDLRSITSIIDSSADLQTHVPEILASFNRFGIAVLEFKSGESVRDHLLSLRSILGSIRTHDRSDADGIAEIKVSDKFPGYLGTSNAAHFFHTDGSYDDNPPAAFALYCVTPARNGGLSQVVSAKALHDWLNITNADALAALYRPDALLVSRAGKSSSKPIFYRDGDRTKISFRLDATARFAEDQAVQNAVSLIKDFLLNNKNVLEFKMEEGQVLLVDNGSILHARTAFPVDDPREMRRLHFDGKPQSQIDLVLGF